MSPANQEFEHNVYGFLFYYFPKTHAHVSGKMYFLLIYCKKEKLRFFFAEKSMIFRLHRKLNFLETDWSKAS